MKVNENFWYTDFIANRRRKDIQYRPSVPYYHKDSAVYRDNGVCANINGVRHVRLV